MTPFEQIKLFYEQLYNLNLEIKKHIEKKDYNEASFKIEQKGSLIKKIVAVRNHLEMSTDEYNELKTKEKAISDLELENISTISQLKDNMLTEIINTNKQQKINNAYDVNSEDQGQIVDFSE